MSSGDHCTVGTHPTEMHSCFVFAGDTGPEVVTVHGAGRGSESKRVQKLHRRGKLPNVVSSQGPVYSEQKK